MNKRICVTGMLSWVLFSCVVSYSITVVHSLSCVQLFETPWTAAPSFLCPPLSHYWELLILSNHVILCHSLYCLRSLPASELFQWVGSLSIELQQPRSFSPSNEYLGLISFSIDWFDLLAVQETFKSLLQHHNLKASILQHSAFFMIQLSHPYMTTRKTRALNIRTFVGKIMSLLLDMLSRFVIAFLPRSKHLLISGLQSQSAVILEPKKIKSVTVFTFSPLLAMKWWDWMPWS